MGTGKPGITICLGGECPAGNRTFLEAIRFDRHGSRGRSALCSWAAFNYSWFGLAGRPWTKGALRLLERGLIDRDTAQASTRLWHFGQLIGNTDMHDGNLSFRPRVSAATSSLIPAPAYDMLPMLYAPQRGVELPPVNFVPRLPCRLSAKLGKTQQPLPINSGRGLRMMLASVRNSGRSPSIICKRFAGQSDF